MENKFVISTTVEFQKWFKKQDARTKDIVRSRFSRIQLFGHFGDCRYLNDGASELKWKNGLRVYFTFHHKIGIVALLGGTKNGQKKDIKKAKEIISREHL
jgi:putative addiction module killer protein